MRKWLGGRGHCPVKIPDARLPLSVPRRSGITGTRRHQLTAEGAVGSCLQERYSHQLRRGKTDKLTQLSDGAAVDSPVSTIDSWLEGIEEHWMSRWRDG
ncbi:uncharacterized protein MONOS_11267 [Monocercomonoides exilis]|uniref:uncharacterized protein n=1 Tax=Monocercomonoides exilis TaxID=2049356 RepID=UPI00355A9EB5|nr:hypothetical protein MONOS_11267 [Monocercomonoides exilis]|eukprot:MONOS_11267.1-p1 / transcript=MONOS_11267.1 / gene=MONOS_11267 / organism=Monocercomonoides_exilis_PA203 / gene_product=unspecified product / transcript_product=unspecified product / location=Mono_scaffold00556:19596-19892(-) / protein_length=99 / sequence_SO=supercontig / SO=protein_coding / is_pseudo=false